MRSILKITIVMALAGLAACSSETGQHVVLMPSPQNHVFSQTSSPDDVVQAQSQAANAGSMNPGSMNSGSMNAATPVANPPAPAETAQASSAAANAAMPPNGVVMPTVAPPEAAYGDPAVSRTPYFYPPIGMGVHVPR